MITPMAASGAASPTPGMAARTDAASAFVAPAPPDSPVMPAMSPAPSLDPSTGLVVLTFSAAFGRPETTLPTPRELGAYRLGLSSPGEG